MVDIQTVSIAIASASVVAGIIYYSLQLRNQNRQMEQQNKIRQADLAIRINPWLNMSGVEFTQMALKFAAFEYKDYDDFVKKYGPLTSDSPASMAFHIASNYFEGVGVLLKRKLIDVDIVRDYCGESVVYTWKRVEPLIKGWRKQFNMPQAWEPFEYLVNEMKKREQKAGVENG
jgi:hypothetical protein